MGVHRQGRWLPLSECLAKVAGVLRKQDAWPEVRDAIEAGLLRARGHCFGIDRQPLQPDWMRVASSDARDNALFFREEKGPNLIPPQHVPPHVTNIQVCADDVERCWPATDEPVSEIELAVGATRKRGPRPVQFDRVKSAMQAELNTGQLTREQLRDEKEMVLEKKYGSSRDTCRRARKAVLSEFPPSN